MSPSPTSKFKNPRAKYNFQGRTCSISGVGSYVPERILTNAELERMVDTSDEWITTRTGIKERRLAAKNEFTSDLAAECRIPPPRSRPQRRELCVGDWLNPQPHQPEPAPLLAESSDNHPVCPQPCHVPPDGSGAVRWHMAR